MLAPLGVVGSELVVVMAMQGSDVWVILVELQQSV